MATTTKLPTDRTPGARRLKRILLDIRRDVQAERRGEAEPRALAICGRVTCHPQWGGRVTSRVLEAGFRAWPKGTGRAGFPVPAPFVEGGERDHFLHTSGYFLKTADSPAERWGADHPYGRARYRLLNWLINTWLANVTPLGRP